jgi:hypothetical protein
MKNLTKLIGITALVAVIGLAFITCDDGNNPNNPNPVFSVSGTFSKGGGNNVAFSLTDAASSGRSARAVTSDTYAVTGVLEDDDFTIRLSGTYDPTARTYTASASANSLGIRYSVNGAYDSSGNSAGSTATLAVKNQTTGEWTATTYVVDETAAVNITGTAVDSEPGGIPAFARGNWYFNYTDTEEDFTASAKILANQWNVNMDVVTTQNGQTDYQSMSSTVVEVEDKGSGKYNVIFAYPVYEPTNANQVAAAVANFFTGKGVTPTRVTEYPDFSTPTPTPLPTGPWYYINVDEDFNIWWGNFSESQWILVNQFYNTSALEKYLISQNVTPTTMYEKNLFQFSSNNTVLSVTPYGELNVEWGHYDSAYSTLALAKAATTLDEENEATLTRNP